MFAARYEPASLKRKHSQTDSETGSECQSDEETKSNDPEKKVCFQLQYGDFNIENVNKAIKKNNQIESKVESQSESEGESGSESESESESGSDNESDSESDSDSKREVFPKIMEEDEARGENDNIDSINTILDQSQRIEDKKFDSIFKKLDQSKKINELQNQNQAEIDNEDGIDNQDYASSLIQSQELMPIPQPEIPKDKHIKISKDNSLNWISTPIYYLKYDETTFHDLFKKYNLEDHELLKNLKNNQFDKAFHVQSVVLNELYSNYNSYSKSNLFKFINNDGDLLINSATGSGKTLSYLVPILLNLSYRKIPKLSCIILLPTKPLVLQVYKIVQLLIKNLKINAMASNSNLSIHKELAKFEIIKPDILICTPGRLVDYLNYKNNISLKYLKYLIIDEVDKLLNQSFQNWITKINEVIVRDQQIQINKLHGINEIENFNHFTTQKLLFSATLNNDVSKLSMLNFYKPKLLIIDEFGNNNFYNLPEKLIEHETFINKVDSFFKPLVLYKIIKDHLFDKNTIIFVKSNENCLRLTKLLQLLSESNNNINFQYLNSTISINNKKKILNKFIKKEINVLLVTDLISRGLDLSNIETVINYDLPISTVDYIHRVGRTARAGKEGSALNLLVGNNDRRWFNKITKSIQRRNAISKINFASISDVEKADYESCLKQLKQEVYEGFK